MATCCKSNRTFLIFAVLVVWCGRVAVKHCFKLLSFFTFINKLIIKQNITVYSSWGRKCVWKSNNWHWHRAVSGTRHNMIKLTHRAIGLEERCAHRPINRVGLWVCRLRQWAGLWPYAVSERRGCWQGALWVCVCVLCSVVVFDDEHIIY